MSAPGGEGPATAAEYAQDGPEAREIAKVIPYFPFKGIPRFYDIGGFLDKPEVFQKIVDIFATRYAGIGIDSIGGLDGLLQIHPPPLPSRPPFPGADFAFALLLLRHPPLHFFLLSFMIITPISFLTYHHHSPPFPFRLPLCATRSSRFRAGPPYRPCAEEAFFHAPQEGQDAQLYF